jgi:uncharacterized protein DUF6515
MRLSGLFFGIFLTACLNPTYSYAQSGEQPRSGEQPEAYHNHHDTRHGHDHAYPDRGAIVRDLPRGTIGINYADVSYRYHDGIWLEPRGPAFVVVAPPIGIVVPTLPTFSTILTQGGETYLYANDTYYRPRPDLDGYEVVNEPAEGLPQAGPDALVGGQLPGATAATPAASKSATPSAVTDTGTTKSTAAASVPATPPTGPPASSSGPPNGPKVLYYPANGQTPDQQARDRDECYRFAVAQSGFDPTRPAGAASAASSDVPQSDYERAQSACFEARGYARR